jgi:hypothetical protein
LDGLALDYLYLGKTYRFESFDCNTYNVIGSLIFGVWGLPMAIGFALWIMEAYKNELFFNVARSWCVNE